MTEFKIMVVPGQNCPADLIKLLRAVDGYAFLAGSGARSLLTLETPGDYDLFLYRREDFDTVISMVYRLGYTEIYSNLAATFGRPGSLRVQIVKPVKDDTQCTYSPRVREVLEQFAFRVQQFAAQIMDGDILVTYAKFGLVDYARNRLVATGIGSPLFVMYSALKYTGKGYKVSLPAIGAILNEWADRPSDWREAELARARWPSGGYRLGDGK